MSHDISTNNNQRNFEKSRCVWFWRKKGHCFTRQQQLTWFLFLRWLISRTTHDARSTETKVASNKTERERGKSFLKKKMKKKKKIMVAEMRNILLCTVW